MCIRRYSVDYSFLFWKNSPWDSSRSSKRMKIQWGSFSNRIKKTLSALLMGKEFWKIFQCLPNWLIWACIPLPVEVAAKILAACCRSKNFYYSLVIAIIFSGYEIQILKNITGNSMSTQRSRLFERIFRVPRTQSGSKALPCKRLQNLELRWFSGFEITNEFSNLAGSPSRPCVKA